MLTKWDIHFEFLWTWVKLAKWIIDHGIFRLQYSNEAISQPKMDTVAVPKKCTTSHNFELWVLYILGKIKGIFCALGILQSYQLHQYTVPWKTAKIALTVKISVDFVYFLIEINGSMCDYLSLPSGKMRGQMENSHNYRQGYKRVWIDSLWLERCQTVFHRDLHWINVSLMNTEAFDSVEALQQNPVQVKCEVNPSASSRAYSQVSVQGSSLKNLAISSSEREAPYILKYNSISWISWGQVKRKILEFAMSHG